MAESGETIDVKVLIVSRRRFALEAEEKRALYCWADRLGGTTAGNSGFETEASLMLNNAVVEKYIDRVGESRSLLISPFAGACPTIEHWPVWPCLRLPSVLMWSK